MTKTPNRLEDKDIEALLDSLAQDTPDMPSHLLGRVLEDAYDAQPLPLDTPTRPAQKKPGQLFVLFGGWTGLSGLAVAASVGFVIGFSPPAALQDRMPLLSGDLVTLEADETSFGWDFEEDAS